MELMITKPKAFKVPLSLCMKGCSEELELWWWRPSLGLCVVTCMLWNTSLATGDFLKAGCESDGITPRDQHCHKLSEQQQMYIKQSKLTILAPKVCGTGLDVTAVKGLVLAGWFWWEAGAWQEHFEGTWCSEVQSVGYTEKGTPFEDHLVQNLVWQLSNCLKKAVCIILL